VHICGGRGSICPATEPTETGLDGPWPTRNAADPDAGDGSDVRVLVIDTGYDPAENAPDPQGVRPWPWLADVTGQPEPDGLRVPPPPPDRLRAYAGHGTFVAGVIKSIAPKCSVHVLNLVIDRQQPGGGVLESQLVDDLYDALDLEELPHLINMSAGCPTRMNVPSRAFQDWQAELRQRFKDPDLVLVAAAGNNSSPWPFWPASFEWAVGVGSLDRDGQVSDFSNWGDSVDVFALGRNVVNAYPDGTYICRECPDRGDERIFNNGLARWSGTSFSAPLVTGLIAAAMSRQQQRSARAARDEVLNVPPTVPGQASTITTIEAPRARPSALAKVLPLP
jgi:subtilisin family serine protease